MKKTLSQKILESHVVKGNPAAGSEIALRIDQTLTQDATGTMAYLQFEAIGVPRVKTELSVSYVDHNTLQDDFKNADDHRFLQSIAARYGIHFSRAGNGICHQLHLERFARPGKTLLGSDSHTPTAGGIGSIAIGAGGLDVAAAMAGMPFQLKYPKILGIRLTGALSSWVSAKDVILEVLRRIDVNGGVGHIIEYFGPGIATLSVPDRATITNMGAETGATCSVFPSDEITRKFLAAQKRECDWVELKADEDCEYDKVLDIDLATVVPLAACPHSPGKIVPVSELGNIAVQQVAIGSCTNSSLRDMKAVAHVLKGNTIHEDLHMVINPGSRQVVAHLVESGEYLNLVEAGARIQENTCGACIGMGAAPSSEAVSVRTYNRNFAGRSGTKDANVYLVSPETAAATALAGRLTDPRTLTITAPRWEMPREFKVNDNMFIPPLDEDNSNKTTIIRGPNIAPLPEFKPITGALAGTVLLKTGDNITTDDIMPAGARVLPFRSNVPRISEFVFETVDKTFPSRALAAKGGFVIGGNNYGQGSSREHAALAPKYLGVKAVVVKSFARIHLANLINFGIVPLTFKNPEDYDTINPEDQITIDLSGLEGNTVVMKNLTNKHDISLCHTLSELDIAILRAGGKLPWIKTQV